MNRRAPRQAGFTIVELMIATAVFSIILLIVMAGVIKFSTSYFKGLTSDSTQTAAQGIVNQVAQAIQFSNGDIATMASNNGSQGYCINGKPYYYLIGKELGSETPNVLVTSDDSCPSQAVDLSTVNLSNLTNARELAGDHMRLSNFSIADGATAGTFTIDVRLVYGDDDLLCSPSVSGTCDGTATMTASDYTNSDLTCRDATGDQFCAASELQTTVEQRL